MRYRFISSSSVFSRIMIISAATVLSFLAGINFLLMPALEGRIVKERIQVVKSVAETAAGVIARAHKKFKSGGTTETSAKGAALSGLRELRHSDGEAIWIVDYSGVVVMDPLNPEKFGKSVAEEDDAYGVHYFAKLVEGAQRDGRTSADFSLPKVEGGRPEPRVAFAIAFPEWKWVVGTGLFIDDLRHELLLLRLKILAGALLIGALVLVASLVTARRITRPLSEAVRVASALGDGNLDARVENPGNDEVGQLCAALNTVGSGFKNILGQMGESVVVLNRSSSGLVNISELMRRTVEDFSAGNALVEATAKTVSDDMGSVREHLAMTNSSMQRVTASTSQLTAMIAEISRNAASASLVTGDARARADELHRKLSSLKTSSERISRVADSIFDISEQTKLLALNATIESARAGDAGRGFAVVASEIKELARQTVVATEQIGSIVAEVHSSNEEALREIIQIVETMEGANSSVAQIARSVEEQAREASLISENITDSTRAVESVAKRVGQSAISVEGLHAQVERMAASISEVLGNSSRLDENAAHIEMLASRFSETFGAYGELKN